MKLKKNKNKKSYGFLIVDDFFVTIYKRVMSHTTLHHLFHTIQKLWTYIHNLCMLIFILR